MDELQELKGLTKDQNKKFDTMVSSLIDKGFPKAKAFAVATTVFKKRHNLSVDNDIVENVSVAEDVKFEVVNKVQVIKESIEGLKQSEGSLLIGGTAIEYGISKNNVIYISEELKKGSESLLDSPFGIDHSGSARDVIGRIRDVKFRNGVVKHITEVVNTSDTPDAVERFKNGLFKETSVELQANKVYSVENDGEYLYFVEGIEFTGLDAVKTPGVESSAAMALEGVPVGISEAFNSSKQEHDVVTMSEEENNTQETTDTLKDMTAKFENLETKMKEQADAITKLTESLDETSNKLEESRAQPAYAAVTSEEETIVSESGVGIEKKIIYKEDWFDLVM